MRELHVPPLGRKEVIQFVMKPEDSFPHDRKPITWADSEPPQTAQGRPSGTPLLRLKVARN